MAKLNGHIGSIIAPVQGSSGAVEGKAGYYVIVFKRGANASAASTGTAIELGDSANAALYAVNDWIQVGYDNTKIRQVLSKGATSLNVNSAVVVNQYDRIVNCGTVQPVTVSSKTTYTPGTSVYPVDSDAVSAVAGSKLTTDADGAYEFYAADNLYDEIVQDSAGYNIGLFENVPLGNGRVYGHLLPITDDTYDIGSTGLYWRNMYLDGTVQAKAVDGGSAVAFVFNNVNTLSNTNAKLHSFRNNSVEKMAVYADGRLSDSNFPPVFNVKWAKYGAKGDGVTNDYAAISSAEADAAAVGGIVWFPTGTYMIGTQIQIGNRVQFWLSPNATIKNTGGIASTAMIRLGKGTSTDLRNTGIRGGKIDCAGYSGVQGIYSDEIQSTCFIRDVEITGADNIGIAINGGSGSTPKGYLIENCHVTVQGVSVTNYPISLYGATGHWGATVRNCTVQHNSGSTPLIGVYIANGVIANRGGVNVEGIYGKRVVSVVEINGNGNVVRGIYGDAATTTNVVRILAGAYGNVVQTAMGGTTYSMTDEANSVNVAAPEVCPLHIQSMYLNGYMGPNPGIYGVTGGPGIERAWTPDTTSGTSVTINNLPTTGVRFNVSGLTASLNIIKLLPIVNGRQVWLKNVSGFNLDYNIKGNNDAITAEGQIAHSCQDPAAIGSANAFQSTGTGGSAYSKHFWMILVGTKDPSSAYTYWSILGRNKP